MNTSVLRSAKRGLVPLAALVAVIGGLAVSSGTAHASTSPLPTALAGQTLVQQFDPSTLVSNAWNPTNQPGNCPTTDNGAFVNSAGYAEIDTTGATNDCESIQSPSADLPTAPGTTYEALMNFSSFHDWPALWMYGPNWPNQGEIDAVEGGPGSSSVTWHQAGNYTIGPDSWDNQQVPLAGGPNIQAGQWTTVDIAFTTSGVDVYYNGQLYVHIPESVTTSGNDPMFLTISEGSCNANGTNVCNGGTSPAGSVQTQWVREFSGSATPTPTPTSATPTPTATTPTPTPTQTGVTEAPTTAPSAPKVSGGTTTSISWNDPPADDQPADHWSYFELLVLGTQGGVQHDVKVSVTSVTMYLSPAGERYYKVRACNPVGCSAYSPSVEYLN